MNDLSKEQRGYRKMKTFQTMKQRKANVDQIQFGKKSDKEGKLSRRVNDLFKFFFSHPDGRQINEDLRLRFTESLPTNHESLKTYMNFFVFIQ